MYSNRATRLLAAIALAATSGTGIAAAQPDNGAAAQVNTVAAKSVTVNIFSAYVANEGEQDAINEYTGCLAKMPSVSEYVGKGYYPIHYECGGAPILDLEVARPSTLMAWAISQ